MEQNDPKVLVVKEYPTALWLVSGVFALFGLVFLITPGGLGGGLIGLGVGLGMLLLGSVDTITLNKRHNRLSIRRRYLWRTAFQEHPLDDVSSFELEASQSSDSGRIYRIIAVMAEGKPIPLTSAYTTGHERKRQRAARLNQWLGWEGATVNQDESPWGASAVEGDEGSRLSTVMGGEKSTTRVEAQVESQEVPAPAVNGETNGVRWQVAKLQVGEMPVRRWFSPDFKFEGGFLLLAQKPEGMRISGKLLGVLGRMFGMQALRLYGFAPEDSPGMETAAPLEPPEPRLEEHYVTLTSNQRAARLALNPWVIMPLVAWGEHNPLRPAQASQEQAQAVILFSPNGVTVAGVGVDTPEEIEALSGLGIELVRAAGG